MKRIVVNDAHHAAAWWTAAAYRLHLGTHACPGSCRPLLEAGGPDAVTVIDRDAAAFVRWARTLNGWEDPRAPEHARWPFVIHPVDPDD